MGERKGWLACICERYVAWVTHVTVGLIALARPLVSLLTRNSKILVKTVGKDLIVTPEETPLIDPLVFREVMGHYPTGVAVVTGIAEDGEELALVVGTFSSVSLDPPLVSFMPMKTSKTFEKLRKLKTMCINILGEEQEDLVTTIARRWENKYHGVDSFRSPAGNPVLAGSVAWVDVETDNIVEAGDHWIVLCRVLDLAVVNAGSPLLFFQGGYGGFLSTSLAARTDKEFADLLEEVESTRGILEGLASGIGCQVTLYRAVSRDEFAQVLSATGPGVDRSGGVGRRLPIVPPIGDTYMYAQPESEQERWIAKARGVSDETKEVFRQRMDFVRRHGYLVAFLPDDNEAAYDDVNEATRQYAQGRMTPAEERRVRETIFNSSVDYELRDIDPHTAYRIGSMVFPVQSPEGGVEYTLRLSQFPGPRLGHRVLDWIERGKSAVNLIESLIGFSQTQQS